MTGKKDRGQVPTFSAGWEIR